MNARAFDEIGLLEAMRAVGGTRLIALDATWYFSSLELTRIDGHLGGGARN